MALRSRLVQTRIIYLGLSMIWAMMTIYRMKMTIIQYRSCWDNDSELHRCQPSRIRRDSPAFSSDVPRPAKWDRCPEFLENSIIIFFVADYFTFLPCNATKWRTSNKARSIPLTTSMDRRRLYFSRNQRLFIFLTPPAGSINTATVSDMPWVMNSDWIIASVLRIICARCFPYSRDTLCNHWLTSMDKMDAPR